jgi:uncharacterized membrane protein
MTEAEKEQFYRMILLMFVGNISLFFGALSLFTSKMNLTTFLLFSTTFTCYYMLYYYLAIYFSEKYIPKAKKLYIKRKRPINISFGVVGALIIAFALYSFLGIYGFVSILGEIVLTAIVVWIAQQLFKKKK